MWAPAPLGRRAAGDHKGRPYTFPRSRECQHVNAGLTEPELTGYRCAAGDLRRRPRPFAMGIVGATLVVARHFSPRLRAMCARAAHTNSFPSPPPRSGRGERGRGEGQNIGYQPLTGKHCRQPMPCAMGIAWERGSVRQTQNFSKPTQNVYMQLLKSAATHVNPAADAAPSWSNTP